MGTVANLRLLRVWTHVTGPLDLADRDAAEQVAQDLLGAGITVDWRHCDPARACSPEDVGPPTVTLILTSAMRPTCGTAALAPAVKAATVLVSVPCVEDVVFKLQRRLSARSHPRLSTLKRRHLLGAAIAHELGHVLGLLHDPASRLMSPRHDPLAQRCIDKSAVAAVARIHALPVAELNWCEEIAAPG